ncbi:unnamed protein product [Dicrocoelium dendriticum]|nr:unnamed protein product [Dicrocoelium dendriticum]
MNFQWELCERTKKPELTTQTPLSTEAQTATPSTTSSTQRTKKPQLTTQTPLSTQASTATPLTTSSTHCTKKTTLTTTGFPSTQMTVMSVFPLITFRMVITLQKTKLNLLIIVK